MSSPTVEAMLGKIAERPRLELRQLAQFTGDGTVAQLGKYAESAHRRLNRFSVDAVVRRIETGSQI
jgi:hypothetical protein